MSRWLKDRNLMYGRPHGTNIAFYRRYVQAAHRHGFRFAVSYVSHPNLYPAPRKPSIRTQRRQR